MPFSCLRESLNPRGAEVGSEVLKIPCDSKAEILQEQAQHLPKAASEVD